MTLLPITGQFVPKMVAQFKGKPELPFFSIGEKKRDKKKKKRKEKRGRGLCERKKIRERTGGASRERKRTEVNNF